MPLGFLWRFHWICRWLWVVWTLLTPTLSLPTPAVNPTTLHGHESSIHVPFLAPPSFPLYPLPPPLWSLAVCSFFPSLWFYFAYLVVLTSKSRNSSNVLNRSGQSGDPYFVPHPWREAFSFLLFSMMLAQAFIYGLYCIEVNFPEVQAISMACYDKFLLFLFFGEFLLGTF